MYRFKLEQFLEMMKAKGKRYIKGVNDSKRVRAPKTPAPKGRTTLKTPKTEFNKQLTRTMVSNRRKISKRRATPKQTI